MAPLNKTARKYQILIEGIDVTSLVSGGDFRWKNLDLFTAQSVSGNITLNIEQGYLPNFNIDDRVNPLLIRGKTVEIKIQDSTGNIATRRLMFILDAIYDGYKTTNIRIGCALELLDRPNPADAVGGTSTPGTPRKRVDIVYQILIDGGINQYKISLPSGVINSSPLFAGINSQLVKTQGESYIQAAQKLLAPALYWVSSDKYGAIRFIQFPTIFPALFSRTELQVEGKRRNEIRELLPSEVKSTGTTLVQTSQVINGITYPNGETPTSFWGTARLPYLIQQANQYLVREHQTEYCASGIDHQNVAVFELNLLAGQKNGRELIYEAIDPLLNYEPFGGVIIEQQRYLIDGLTIAFQNNEISAHCNLLLWDNQIVGANGINDTGQGAGLNGGGSGGASGSGASGKPSFPPPSAEPPQPPTPAPTPETIPNGPVNQFCAVSSTTLTPINPDAGVAATVVSANTTFSLQTTGNGTKITASPGGQAATWSLSGNYTSGACGTTSGPSDPVCQVYSGPQTVPAPAGKIVSTATAIGKFNGNVSSCPAIATGSNSTTITDPDCIYQICFAPDPYSANTQTIMSNSNPFKVEVHYKVQNNAASPFPFDQNCPGYIIYGITGVRLIEAIDGVLGPNARVLQLQTTTDGTTWINYQQYNISIGSPGAPFNTGAYNKINKWYLKLCP